MLFSVILILLFSFREMAEQKGWKHGQDYLVKNNGILSTGWFVT